MIPKVGRAEDVHTVSTILASLEAVGDENETIGLEVQIENAAGLLHCEEIAVASSRLVADGQ